MLIHQSKQTIKTLIKLLEYLGEINDLFIAGDENFMFHIMLDINNKVEEEKFTIAKLHINEMQSEVKNLMQRCEALETFQVNCNKKICEYKRKLFECRLLVSQHEARILTLTESTEEAEVHKRVLEEDVDSLRKECEKLKAAEQAQAVNNQEKAQKEEAATKLRITFEEQMDQLRDIHQKQVATFRDEISEKQEMINELKDQNQKFILSHNQIQVDYERLKQEEAEKSVKLQEMILVNERREQSRKDLKELEETVGKELQILHNLRKSFILDLQLRNKKNVNAEDKEDDGGSKLAQKQKISFLENNLDQLTKAYKQLVGENSGLRCELPKLEKRLRATMNNYKAVETELRDAKKVVLQDRKGYQQEVNRLNEVIRQMNLAHKLPNLFTLTNSM